MTTTALSNTIERITSAMIEANVIGEHYFSCHDGLVGACEGPHAYQSKGNDTGTGLLTFCVLTLRNGFMVTGESACANLEIYNAAIGRQVARANAISKCWTIMGYALRARMYGTDGLEPVA